MKDRAVTILETILPSDVGQDAPLLAELLRMSGVEHEVRTFSGRDGRNEFIGALLGADTRFIHVSAHGEEGSLYIHGERGTEVSASHIESFWKGNAVGRRPPLDNKFVTVSACGEISASLARNLREATGAVAVVAPMLDVGFDEAAVFVSLLYFALARHPGMRGRGNTATRLSQFVDAFQRAKGAYLAVGGCGAYRLDYWWRGEQGTVV